MTAATYGDDRPAAPTELEEGALVRVNAVHQVLQRELAHLRPKTGDRLKIAYMGRLDGDRTAAHIWRVRRAGQAGTGVQWDRYGGGGGEPEPVPDVPADTAGLGGAADPQRPTSRFDDDIPFD